MEAKCGRFEQTSEVCHKAPEDGQTAETHDPDGPMNSGPGLTQAGRCVLLAKCFWKTQQSPKAAPFHPPSLKEELWLSTYKYNFILLKDVKIKRHDALNKGYVNRNTFITKNQKNQKTNSHCIELQYGSR